MKKLALIILFFVTSLIAQSTFNPQKSTITALKGGYAFVNGANDLAKGVSGVVIRDFDGKHKAIIASATIVKNDGGAITLKLSKYNDLKQDVLPTYDIPVKVGDEVILNYHYDRALVIAPNKESYENITKTHTRFDFVHPDIYASYLNSSFHSTPSKKNLKSECIEDSIGLLIFNIKDKNYFVDCKTFSILGAEPTTPASTFKTPFYTRIDKIKGRFAGLFGGSGVKDYNSFYTKLLRER